MGMGGWMSKNFYVMRRGWRNNHVFADEPYTEREAFEYLIEGAAWKDRLYRVGNKVVKLKRGQLTASYRYLAEAWKWNKNKVSAFLSILQDSDMIQTETGTVQTIITICNYSKYQDVQTEAGTDMGQNKGQPRDRCGTDAGQMRDKTNQDNQDNQDNQSVTRDDDLSPQKVASLWNEICTSLRPVNGLSLDRENKIKNLMRTPLDSKKKWEIFFNKISNSSFLRGEKESFQATFDWAINPRNTVKILDGNYDDRESQHFDPAEEMERIIQKKKEMAVNAH